MESSRRSAGGRSGDEAPPYVWIDEPSAVVQLARDVARDPGPLALDTEANSFHAYRPRLCLIQLAWRIPAPAGGTRVALIDVPALGDEPLAPLRGVLESPEREKILHGADNDVRLLARDGGVGLRGLFDTQIAARILGLAKTGLAALAEDFLDVRVPKSAQRLDWGRRPLPAAALRYAALDASMLFGLRDALLRMLDTAGREHWAAEEFEALETARFPEWTAPTTAELMSRISGASKLDPAARAILRELVLWRESEAERRDVPPVHVAPPKQLLALAKQKSPDRSALRRAGIAARTEQRYGKALLAAVERGLAGPPLPRDTPRRPGGESSPDPADPARVAALRRLRRARASALGIEEGTLFPTSVVRAVARSGAAERVGMREAGLREWQIEALGLEALRRAIRATKR